MARKVHKLRILDLKKCCANKHLVILLMHSKDRVFKRSGVLVVVFFAQYYALGDIPEMNWRPEHQIVVQGIVFACKKMHTLAVLLE